MNKGTAAAAIARLIAVGLITAQASKGAVTRYYIRTSDEVFELSENRAQSNNGEVSQIQSTGVSNEGTLLSETRAQKYISTEGDPRSSSSIPSGYKPIVDRYNEILGGKNGWTPAKRFTDKLARVLPIALERCGQPHLSKLFHAVAEGNVNGYAPTSEQKNLTLLLWACVYGEIKIPPQHYPSVQDQQRLRRANEEQPECA